MLGMVVVDTWKALKIGVDDPYSLREFSDTKELTEEVEELKDCKKVVQTVVTCKSENSISVSSLSTAKACSSHTKVVLENG